MRQDLARNRFYVNDAQRQIKHFNFFATGSCSGILTYWQGYRRGWHSNSFQDNVTSPTHEHILTGGHSILFSVFSLPISFEFFAGHRNDSIRCGYEFFIRSSIYGLIGKRLSIKSLHSILSKVSLFKDTWRHFHMQNYESSSRCFSICFSL